MHRTPRSRSPVADPGMKPAAKSITKKLGRNSIMSNSSISDFTERAKNKLGALIPLARCLGVVGIVTLGLAATSGAAEKPNILLIVSDDQGYHDLGALNDKLITP